MVGYVMDSDAMINLQAFDRNTIELPAEVVPTFLSLHGLLN